MAIPIQLSSIRYAVVCAGGLLGFALLALFPSYRALSALDTQIRQLQRDIAEQQKLQPIFAELLKRAQKEAPSQLPFPKKAKLPRSETGAISSFFQKLAQEQGFEVATIIPEVASMPDGSAYLKLDSVIRGGFPQLRSLLLRLEELPYLEHIEGIEVRTQEQAKEIRLKFWLAQQSE